MNKFVIVTDTSSDLPKSYLEENGIPVLNLYYTIDGTTSTNGCPTKEEIKSFYDKMREGSEPKTQQVDPDQAENLFNSVLSKGDDVLYIGFSSALSGTVNSARIAAEELKEKFPQQKIIIIDTLCASLGEGMLVDYAVEMQKKGKNIKEIAAWLEANKLNICHNFTVDDLVYLQRGGRISKATAVIGTMIGIKPILHMDDNGKLVPINKVRGRKISLTALVDNMQKQMGKFSKNQKIFISHGDCPEDADFVAKLVKQRTGCGVSLINEVGPTIGSHSGPGTVALFFMGEHR